MDTHDPWMTAMRLGDFETAWRVSDAVLAERLRQRTGDWRVPRHQQFLWDGRPLAGRSVLVHCYHGLGDTLQFVRLLPSLRRHAKSVVLWVQPALLGLLRGFPGVDRLEPLHDGAPDVTRDADVELMELPHALRLTVDAIPSAVPYLRVPPPLRRYRGPPRIGLVWRASGWDGTRSIPASLLAPLARLRGLRWVSLQFPAEPAPLPVVDAGCRDLVGLARRMLAVDLVVSVDTMAAHLAGALGCPVWTLLPRPCDWRWMEGRDDSPWYRTMRLIRQVRPGDWADVIARLAGALSHWRDAREALAEAGERMRR